MLLPSAVAWQPTSTLAALWSQAYTLYMLNGSGASNEDVVTLARRSPIWGAMFVSTAATVVFPCQVLFAVSLTASVAYLLAKAPDIPNSSTYLLLVKLVLAVGAWQAVALDQEESALWRAAKGARCVTVVLYLFAAVAKSNPDFLDPRLSACNGVVISCLRLLPDACWPPTPAEADHRRTDSEATELKAALLSRASGADAGPTSQRTGTNYPLRRVCVLWVLVRSPYLAVVIEWAVPLLLVQRGSWTLWGTWAAFMMHMIMGPLAYDYSAAMQASLCCFWPESVGDIAFMTTSLAARVIGGAAVAFLAATSNNNRLAAVWPRAFHALSARTVLLPGETGTFVQAAWCFWSMLLLPRVSLSAFDAPFATPGLDGSLLPPRPRDAVSLAVWLCLACSLVLGLMPYLGLRTHATWTMFSNLVVEGSQSNHFFMPRRMRVFGLLENVATVLDSDDVFFRSFIVGVDPSVSCGPRLQALIREAGVGTVVQFAGSGYGCFDADSPDARGPIMPARLPYSLPWAQLRRMAHQRLQLPGGFELRYSLKHREHVFRAAAAGGAIVEDSGGLLREPVPWFQRKLLAFRPCSTPGNVLGCT